MKSSVGCVVMMCLLVTSARGQTAGSFECETNAACAALYEQGAQQSKAGQLVEAEKSYRLAYEVSRDARLLFNIARVLDKRGQGPEAVTYYRRFIEAPIEATEQKEKARGYVAQLEGKRPSQKKPTELLTVGRETMTPNPEVSDKPIYKKGCFFGVMVGSVAAVGLGIGLGVGLSSRGPTVPSGTNGVHPTF